MLARAQKCLFDISLFGKLLNYNFFHVDLNQCDFAMWHHFKE